MKRAFLLLAGATGLFAGSVTAFLSNKSTISRKLHTSLKAESTSPGFASSVEGIGYGKPECPQIATVPAVSPMNKVVVFALGWFWGPQEDFGRLSGIQRTGKIKTSYNILSDEDWGVKFSYLRIVFMVMIQLSDIVVELNQAQLIRALWIVQRR